jgi:hypothetical protein
MYMASGKKGAAQAPTTEGAEAAKETSGQGQAVVLPNGQKRIDFIRNEYYDSEPPYEHVKEKNKSRSDIKKNINEMLKAAGQEDKQIPYQIVFGATKEKVDPRKKVKQAAAPAAA